MLTSPINKIYISRLIDKALEEDLGTGDITTESIVGNSDDKADGDLLAKEDGVLCGIDIFEATVRRLDATAEFQGRQFDGDAFFAGDILRRVRADAGALLSAERVALNFLQHLSGIATLTAKYVKAVEGTNARITDTRKTIPGLRLLEKWAVRCGGGVNHRFSLSDMVLIKDNHIAYAGGITNAVKLVRANASHAMKVEIEVNTYEQAQEALECKAEVIMLDNMCIDDICKAVKMINGRALVEASGGINLDNVRAYAECGVDIISVGRLTHSAAGVDISLNLDVFKSQA